MQAKEAASAATVRDVRFMEAVLSRYSIGSTGPDVLTSRPSVVSAQSEFKGARSGLGGEPAFSVGAVLLLDRNSCERDFLKIELNRMRSKGTQRRWIAGIHTGDSFGLVQ